MEDKLFLTLINSKKNIICNEKDDSLYYQNSVGKSINTNYSQSKEKKHERNKGFFEVNISLNNYLKNDNILEESNYKISNYDI